MVKKFFLHGKLVLYYSHDNTALHRTARGLCTNVALQIGQVSAHLAIKATTTLVTFIAKHIKPHLHCTIHKSMFVYIELRCHWV